MQKLWVNCAKTASDLDGVLIQKRNESKQEDVWEKSSLFEASNNFWSNRDNNGS